MVECNKIDQMCDNYEFTRTKLGIWEMRKRGTSKVIKKSRKFSELIQDE